MSSEGTARIKSGGRLISDRNRKVIMAEPDERATFNQVGQEIVSCTESMGKVSPGAAEKREDHLVMDQ